MRTRRNIGIFILLSAFCLVPAAKAQVPPTVVWQSKATNSYILNPLALSPDKSLVATLGVGNAVHIWQATNGALTQTLLGHAAAIGNLAFSDDGLYLASSSGDKTVRVWKRNDWSLAYSFSTTNQFPPIAFAPDSATLAVGNGTSIQLRHTTNGAIYRSWNATGSFAMIALAYSPDGTKLASGAGWRGSDTALSLWDVSSGSLLRAIPTSQTYNVGHIVFSPDGNDVLTGSEYLTSGPMQSWRVSDGAHLHTFPVAAYAMAFNADGTILASVGTNITFFRYSDGSVIQEYSDGFPGITPGAKGIAFANGLFLRSRGAGEILAGRIPLQVSPPLLIGGQTILSWIGGTGRYQLQRSSLLGDNWENVGGVLMTNQVTLSTTTNSFFRLVDLLE